MLYLLGVWLRRLPDKFSTEAQRERIARTRSKACEWLPWLLVLAPLPVGGTIIIVAGFFRLRPALTAAVLLASEALWRAMPYLR
jgi:membrane protein YqaA with SNARE-associated domain